MGRRGDDLRIAATALACGGTVVTGKFSDFKPAGVETTICYFAEGRSDVSDPKRLHLFQMQAQMVDARGNPELEEARWRRVVLGPGRKEIRLD